MSLTIQWNTALEEQRPRYGKTWTVFEFNELTKLWAMDTPLPAICHRMGRPMLGVLIKLESLRLIKALEKWDQSWRFVKRDQPEAVNQTRNTLENNMTVPNIENRFFISGRDASELTDDQIIDYMLKLNRRVRELQNLELDSKKVEERIKCLESDIISLGKYLDAR